MDLLAETSIEGLQDTLENIEGNKPTQQLLAAISCKNGITQTEISEWYGTGWRNIFNWLIRLETDYALDEAISDDIGTGRKQKLS